MYIIYIHVVVGQLQTYIVKYLSEAVEEEFKFHMVLRQSNVLLMVAEKDTPDRNQKWNTAIRYGPGPFVDLPEHPGSEPKNGPPQLGPDRVRSRTWTQLSGLQKGCGLVVGTSVVLKWRVYLTIKIWMVSNHLKL